MPEKEAIADSGHIRALDGLRGVAVLGAFFYHALAFELIDPHGVLLVIRKVAACGWLGVDLFFVLSGFLITTILLDARGADNYFRVFYARRALRITPLYYLVLGLALLFSPTHYSFTTQLPFWLNLSNLDTAFYSTIPFLLHFWSLAIEEQFYFVWPTVVRYVSDRAIAITCVVVCVAVFIARNLPVILSLNQQYPEFIYRFTLLRIDTLCGGALIALLVRHRSTLLQKTMLIRVIFLLSAALFALSKGYYRSVAVDRYGFTALLVAGSSLLVLALRSGSITSRILSTPLLRAWGKYSYSVYLLHYFVLAYAGQHLDTLQRLVPALHTKNATILFALPFELAFVFLVSALSWRFFEGPILKYKRHFRYNPRPEHYLA